MSHSSNAGQGILGFITGMIMGGVLNRNNDRCQCEESPVMFGPPPPANNVIVTTPAGLRNLFGLQNLFGGLRGPLSGGFLPGNDLYSTWDNAGEFNNMPPCEPHHPHHSRRSHRPHRPHHNSHRPHPHHRPHPCPPPPPPYVENPYALGCPLPPPPEAFVEPPCPHTQGYPPPMLNPYAPPAAFNPYNTPVQPCPHNHNENGILGKLGPLLMLGALGMLMSKIMGNEKSEPDSAPDYAPDRTNEAEPQVLLFTELPPGQGLDYEELIV